MFLGLFKELIAVKWQENEFYKIGHNQPGD